MPKGRILIVDDEPVIAESLSELLEGWGYETAVASDGLAGLAKVEEFRPSVVVSDVYMPKLDGFGLLREMRELHPETAVILLTGQGTVEMALRAIQDEGAFHSVVVAIHAAKLDEYERLVDLLREEPGVTKGLYIDMKRLVSASLID